jgi:hypothetical protein
MEPNITTYPLAPLGFEFFDPTVITTAAAVAAATATPIPGK